MPVQRPPLSEATEPERTRPLPLPLPTGLEAGMAGPLGRAAGRALDGLVPGRAPATFARAEREALCRSAMRVGPDAPTLCGGWDVRTLVAHLVVREREPLGAAGIILPRLEALTENAIQRRARRGFATNLGRLRRPGVSPFAVPVLERLVNTLEFFVHHEDIRRAGEGGPPRDLPTHARRDLWLGLRALGGLLLHGAAMPVALRRTDAEGARDAAVLHSGPGRRHAPVTVVGDTGELVLFCYGRGDVADVRLEGDEVSARRLWNADLGL